MIMTEFIRQQKARPQDVTRSYRFYRMLAGASQQISGDA